VLSGLLPGASSLATLNVASNKLGVEGGMKLAEALPKMPNLREVNLDNNYLCGVDEYGGGKFTPDAINAICDALTKSNVQSISVKKNGITGEAAQKLAKVVLEMPSMADFCGIPIKALRDNTATDLDLSKHSLGAPEGMVLSGLLPGASSLATLNVASNKLGVEGGIKLAEALPKMPNLCEVNLADNNLTNYGEDMSAVIKLAEAFTQMPNLQTVNLADNNLTNQGRDMSAVIKLADAFTKMPNLRKVNVDGHPLPIDKLRGTKPTESIDLSSKGLQVASGMIIASCITGNEHLKSLNVASNGLGVEGGVKLAEAFAKMPNLREVNLADNYLTCGGGDMSAVITLAEAFTKMPNLREVNLDNNQLCGVAQNGRGTFTLVAISAICDALTKSNIQSISLDNNQLCGVDEYGGGKFTLDAINAICDALTKSNIQSISIKDNRLNQKAKQALESVAAGRDVKIDF